MITILRTIDRRIVFAIMLSLLMHAAILWLPQVRLPHAEMPLPPLTARLEAIAESSQPAKPEPKKPATKTVIAAPARQVAEAADKAEEHAAHHPFPEHMQFTFAVYKAADGFKIGDAHRRLDINGDRYTLKAVKQTAGLAGLLNDEQTIQISRGKITAQGLQPESFTEEKSTRGGKQKLKATFDWSAQKLRFLHGGETVIADGAQDALSFMYQLSQLSMRREIIQLDVSDGKRLESDNLEISGEEDITTPMGKMRALHLRKMHVQGEAYFEIWLGLEYRSLPVKIRQIDGSDEVTEEIVISDIRIADK